LPKPQNGAYDDERGKAKVRVTTRLPSTVVFAGVACAFALAVPALADPLAEPTPLERSAGVSSAPSLGQKYDGVVPGPTGKNPLPAAPEGGAYLVWTGFQMTSAGSQVFLQTTRQVAIETKAGQRAKSGRSTLAIVLRSCRIHMANNRRRIDTRYFATPVVAVSARQRGSDVEVHIALREPVTVDPRVQAGPEGTQFVVLDFPPGKAEPEPSALQDLAAGSDLSDGNRAQDDDSSDGAPSKGGKAGKARRKAPAKSSP
jgi:hypothetical protein